MTHAHRPPPLAHLRAAGTLGPAPRTAGVPTQVWVVAALVMGLHGWLLWALPSALRAPDLRAVGGHAGALPTPVWVTGGVVLTPTSVPAALPSPQPTALASTVPPAAQSATGAAVRAPSGNRPSAESASPTRAQAPAPTQAESASSATAAPSDLQANSATSGDLSAQAAIKNVASVDAPNASSPPTGTPPTASTAAQPGAAAGGEAVAADAAKAASSAPAVAGIDAPAWLGSALAVPGSARLRYAVTGQARGFGYEARSTVAWLHDGQRYEARMEVGALFLGNRVQTSVGTLGPQGLAPVRFGDQARREVAAHFEPAQQRIRFSANSPDAPWRPGSQDRLSVLFQLSALMAADAGRWSTPGQRLPFWTVGPRDAEAWVFVVQGRVPTAAAEVSNAAVADAELLHLSRAPRREFDLTVDVWLAPSLGYLPARIRIAQGNGDWVDQRLLALERP